jgi:hypothetical protein
MTDTPSNPKQKPAARTAADLLKEPSPASFDSWGDENPAVDLEVDPGALKRILRGSKEEQRIAPVEPVGAAQTLEPLAAQIVATKAPAVGVIQYNGTALSNALQSLTGRSDSGRVEQRAVIMNVAREPNRRLVATIAAPGARMTGVAAFKHRRVLGPRPRSAGSETRPPTLKRSCPACPCCWC